MTPSLKALQTGGSADVFLNEDTGVCFKIFHKKGLEIKEFQVVRLLMDKYATTDVSSKDCSNLSRVMKYLNYGYITKTEALDMYRKAYQENTEKCSQFEKNFENEVLVPIIAMEYIEGIDGLEFGLKYGPLDECTAMELMTSTLMALQEFHSLDLIHRDIKPDNFIITQNENGKYNVKLIDFGLAYPAKDGQSVFVGNTGTKRYQPPESLKGSQSRSSDLFAVAISFYMLCGSPSEFKSKFLKLLLKLTDVNPLHRGTVSEAIKALKEIQKVK